MRTELIKYKNKEYLKVELVEFHQKGQSFYLAKIKALDFLKIFTVRPAQYDLEKHSSLANSFEGDDKYYSHLINEDREKIKDKDFQRDASSERVSSIVRFLNEEEYAFFPNTIIANCELINDWEDFSINDESTDEEFFDAPNKPEFISFLRKDGEKDVLYIPFIENSVLVIDGQHRLEGLQNVNESIQATYDLIIAFIIGFDRSVVARQFYTVNYEQKPVNKSLLYQLTGEFTREINELSFLHNVAKLLNELEESPFKGRIKMLGVTPKNLSKEDKAKLSISQAFLIDSMIRFVSKRAIGSLYSPIFLKYFEKPEDHINIIRIIARYFTAVKSLKDDWQKPGESLLSKGMGVGALMKVLNFLFPILFKKEMESEWSNLSKLTVDTFKTALDGLKNVDFSSDGPFGKTASAGSVNKIKDAILQNLVYLDKPQNIKEFETQYRTDYLEPFTAKLEKPVKEK